MGTHTLSGSPGIDRLCVLFTQLGLAQSGAAGKLCPIVLGPLAVAHVTTNRTV